MKKIRNLFLLLIAILLLAGCYLIATRQMTVPFFYRFKAGNEWKIGTIRTVNPLQINKDSIITIDFSINQVRPEVRFMADPFVVEENGTYYIFYEYFPSKMNSTWADIAVLKSEDLTNWEYLGIVLDEDFHLSYPQIFKINGNWYMIPETSGANEIRLYATDNFPYNWKLKKTLVKDRIVVDATLIVKNDIFYLLAHENEKMVLFYSDNIEENWQEHPQSPLREQDTRPGGNPVVLNEKITYFIQDHTHGYGTGLISYEIDSISPTFFADHRADTVLWRFGDDWAMGGMHQLSSIQLPDGSWFCVVDGCHWKKQRWGWDWLNFPVFRLKK